MKSAKLKQAGRSKERQKICLDKATKDHRNCQDREGQAAWLQLSSLAGPGATLQPYPTNCSTNTKIQPKCSLEGANSWRVLCYIIPP